MFGKRKNTGTANWQDEQTRFKVIFDSLEDGVILIDAEQTIQLINPAAATICGWKIDEATGVSVTAVVKLVTNKGEPIAADANPFEKLFKDGQNLHDEQLFLLSRDNKQLSISFSLSPLVSGEQTPSAAVAIIRDVSQRRAQEQQRADFISTASHEMRTPVAAIEGYLALALNDKVSTVDERARGYLEKAHSSTQHLGKLFQDLLTSAKAEDGRLVSHPGVIEIGSYLEQVTSDLRFAAEKKGLAVDFSVGNNSIVNKRKAMTEKIVKPLYYVYADPDRLREVITNLFDNAVKYTDEGKITIGLTGDNQVVQCSVSDTGPGIPADDLPHLFQKFYRVDNSTTRTIGGTGLGLFICKKIIELYNGRIWVESELGKGSSFYINLPRLTNQQATDLQQRSETATVLQPVEPLDQELKT
ncbi:MAG TPA: ATP-binding protein [Candidatus Saccharimonadales bacterium]|nr:ATP-binding protein [Candidatus Saccharimonadales bacterium]